MYRRRLLIIAALPLLLPATAASHQPDETLPPAAADSFRIDPSHTHVGFAVRHLALATVRGEFREVSASLIFDAADPLRSTVQVRINAGSLNTGNERRDTDLRTNFLNVEAHPEITFVSKRIERDGTAYRAVGDLTLNGVTREVQLPFDFTGPVAAPGNITRIGVAGTLEIDRREFGVELQRMADNVLVVGNQVKITLDVEFGRRTVTSEQ